MQCDWREHSFEHSNLLRVLHDFRKAFDDVTLVSWENDLDWISDNENKSTFEKAEQLLWRADSDTVMAIAKNGDVAIRK